MGKILILGGTGAMGAFLVKRLSASHELYVTSRQSHSSTKNIKYIKGNGHDETFLDSVLHQEKWTAIIDFMHYGTGEFRKRYKTLLANTSQYIFLSSSRVYANSEHPLTEDSPRLLEISTDKEYLKSDDYALAKARQENLLKTSGKNNWTCIRPYMTYDSYRLDLGYFPKELWLYRVLHGRSILFPNDVASKKTTLTYGDDVANDISLLVGNPAALGKIFQITQPKQHTWSEIITLYKSIFRKYGILMTVKRVDSMPIKEPIYVYDRVYNRVFDNSRIEKIIGQTHYVDIENGLGLCIKTFLSSPRFKDIDWKKQAYWDRMLNEHTPLSEIPDFTHKLQYLLFRYIVSYQTIKEILHFTRKIRDVFSK